jgi:hypothetical protein
MLIGILIGVTGAIGTILIGQTAPKPAPVAIPVKTRK